MVNLVEIADRAGPTGLSEHLVTDFLKHIAVRPRPTRVRTCDAVTWGSSMELSSVAGVGDLQNAARAEIDRILKVDT